MLALSNSSLKEENIFPIRPICFPTALAAASPEGFFATGFFAVDLAGLAAAEAAVGAAFFADFRA